MTARVSEGFKGLSTDKLGKKRASVILDLIYPNGLSFNRFISADFNNGKLDEDSVDIVKPEKVNAPEFVT